MPLWKTLALTLWALALVTASTGFFLGRTVFDRGVVYDASLPVLPDLDVPRRAINTQLELEPDVESVQRSLRLIKQAGFGWIRQQFAWDAVETSSKGQYHDTTLDRSNWQRFDDIVRLARDEGIEILARLDLPPAWARPPDSYKSHPPIDVRDYGDFVEAFVDRYRGEIRYVQLWNEPNLNEEWGRRSVDPVGYVELLRAGYEGAKRADPAVRVVSAELAQTLEPDDPSASGLDDLVFLDRMYLHGAKPYFDVLAANAYGLGTGHDSRQVAPQYTNFSRVLLTREVMLRHGDAAKAMWVTEFGWNALPPGWTGEPSPWGTVSAEEKARYIVGAYDRAAIEWPWMGPMALWLFRKPGADARDPTPYFALVGDDWEPRPAFAALVATAGRQPLGTGVHQESSPGLSFSGLWQWTPDERASLAGLRETPVSGAAVRWTFRGTQVEVIAPVGPSRGIAFVKVNGAYTLANGAALNRNGQAALDFYAADDRPQQRIMIASGLPDRVHEVELVVSGEHYPASTAAGIGVDAVIVSRSRPSLPLIALGGAWGLTAAAIGWTFLRRARSGPRDPPAAARATRVAPLLETVRLAERIPWVKAAVLAVFAALPLAPLGIRTPAGTYSPVELLVLAAAGLLAAAHLRGYTDVRLSGAYSGPLAVLVATGIVSTVVADYPRLALRELRTLVVEPALFYLVARSVLRGPRDGLHVAQALAAGGAAAGALAVAQTVGGVDLVAAEGVARAAALHSSPNNLALLLDRAWPLALAGTLYLAGPRRRLFQVALALMACALFFTFSRGAWMAVAPAAAIVAWPRFRALEPSLRRRLARVALAAGVPLLALAGIVALQVERFRSLFDAAGTGVLRVHLWQSAVRMALDHPWLGVGLDQFLYHYPRYIHADAWREPNLSHPHNIVLDFWLRLGIAGLAALTWGAVAFLRSLRRAQQARARGRGTSESNAHRASLPAVRLALVAGAAGAAAALTLHGLVDNSFFVIDLAYATLAVLLIAELAAETEAGTSP